MSENQLAGDELLLLSKDVLPYSYITKGKVIAYEISDVDLRNLPKEFLVNIENNCVRKL